MCCVLTAFLLAGPRLAILIWWLMQPARWSTTYPSFLVPLVGFLFLPFVTLMYVLVFPGGVNGFDWLWLGLALAADIASYGGGYRNKDRIGR
jgi:hypothetical protein